MMRKIFLLLSTCLFFAQASAAVFPACVMTAAEAYGVSPLLLKSIIRVESRGNPYSFNIQFSSQGAKEEFLSSIECSVAVKNSVSVSCNDRESAVEVLKWIKKHKRYIKTFDVGIMQINDYWIKTFNLNPEWLLDACYNIKWGAYILSYNFNLFGYNWKAVWKYNGSRKYLNKVLEEIRKICVVEKDNLYCRNYFR